MDQNSYYQNSSLYPPNFLQQTYSQPPNDRPQGSNFITITDLNNFKAELKEEIQRAEKKINDELKEEIQRTEKKINDEFKEQTEGIKRVLTRVLEEVKSTNYLRTKPKIHIIPKKPYSSVDEFLKFETEITNDAEKYSQLLSDFEEQTANCLQKFVKSMWKIIIDDEAAQYLCWKGTETKKSVRSLTITQALKATCIKKFSPAADFEKFCIFHFQHAKGRFQKKQNYVKKQPNENN